MEQHESKRPMPLLRELARRIGVAYLALAAVMILLGEVLVRLQTLDRWDEHVNVVAAGHRTPWATRLFEGASFLANTEPVVAIAVAACLVIWWRTRSARNVVVLIVALVLEITVFLSTTFIVGRSRPHVPRFQTAPPTGSYPSGHTAAATALVLSLTLLLLGYVVRRWTRIGVVTAAATVVVLVASSRVYLGMHHPTDVVAGMGFGAGCVAASRRIVEPTDEAIR